MLLILGYLLRKRCHHRNFKIYAIDTPCVRDIFRIVKLCKIHPVCHAKCPKSNFYRKMPFQLPLLGTLGIQYDIPG